MPGFTSKESQRSEPQGAVASLYQHEKISHLNSPPAYPYDLHGDNKNGRKQPTNSTSTRQRYRKSDNLHDALVYLILTILLVNTSLIALKIYKLRQSGYLADLRGAEWVSCHATEIHNNDGMDERVKEQMWSTCVELMKNREQRIRTWKVGLPMYCLSQIGVVVMLFWWWWTGNIAGAEGVTPEDGDIERDGSNEEMGLRGEGDF